MLSLALAAYLAAPPLEPQGTTVPRGTMQHEKTGLGDGNWFPEGDLVEMCKGNVPNRGGDVCCPSSCIDDASGEPRCGGARCSNRPGGAAHCCIKEIEATHFTCHENTDTVCIMPTRCEEDRCLIHCPLNPGCSVIWKNRGLDYLAMREKMGLSTSLSDSDAAAQSF
eukprot:scaffold104856_cov63-Phaeocystis_antarctica.AAC.1